jgi:hypothetical protein
LYFSQALRGLFAIFVQLGCSTSNRGYYNNVSNITQVTFLILLSFASGVIAVLTF